MCKYRYDLSIKEECVNLYLEMNSIGKEYHYYYTSLDSNYTAHYKINYLNGNSSILVNEQYEYLLELNKEFECSVFHFWIIEKEYDELIGGLFVTPKFGVLRIDSFPNISIFEFIQSKDSIYISELQDYVNSIKTEEIEKTVPR